ncbi:MAG: hypothetical protein NTW21_12345 [Verrucomicrobia bacterium]|nr:hypothetical protein [Verrucomicrobiota bacterium]
MEWDRTPARGASGGLRMMVSDLGWHTSGVRYYSGSKEFMAESFMAESFMAESFFKSLEGDSSLAGLSACGCAQTGVDPMTFSNSEMILPSMILPYLSNNVGS